MSDRVGHTETPDKFSVLLPAERMALSVAQAQLQRGENPPINVTTVLVMALERLREELREDRMADEVDWSGDRMVIKSWQRRWVTAWEKEEADDA